MRTPLERWAGEVVARLHELATRPCTEHTAWEAVTFAKAAVHMYAVALDVESVTREEPPAEEP